MKSMFFLAAVPILMLLVPNVYAGGPRADYDEAYQDIKGAPECWVDEYDAGFAGVYDRQRANESSKILGDQYNVSWKWGCEGGGFDEYRCKNIKKYSDVRIDHEILQNANMGKCWTDWFSDGQRNNTYNFDRSSGCSEYGRMYKNGFIDGCKDPTSMRIIYSKASFTS